MQVKVNDLLWEAQMKYNQGRQEIERLLPGGISRVWQYDQAGRPGEQQVRKNGTVTHWKKYSWDTNDRLVNIFDAISHGNTHFKHDAFSNLVFAQYADNSIVHRTADATGNFYETKAKTDRKYSSAGALLESEKHIYKYDEEGYLISKTDKANHKKTSYDWYANGMLKKVVRPDGKEVSFTYDALGRRISKCFGGQITRWVWDGNVPLHEWTYNEEDKPTTVVNKWGDLTFDKQEPYAKDTAITWIFEADSVVPAAKILNGNTYSIITDHLGTPHSMFDEKGNKVWEGILDIYGRSRTLHGNGSAVPFRYQGQYEDAETGLYYNRFRYYDPEGGKYISQDPIRLSGNNPTLYGYVKDPNIWVDVFGLRCKIFAKNPKEAHAGIKKQWGHQMTGPEMRELQKTVDRIKRRAPQYSNDGTPFQNSHTIGNPDAQRLNTGNTYTEWTVKTPGVGNNGARRIVMNDQTGEAFYTHDHYDSYIKLDLSGWN
jgi:RHS repeat-associated protein